MWVGCVWGLLSISSWLINPLTQKSWIALGGQSKAFHFGHYPWLILFKCLQCFEVSASVNKEISWHTSCQHLNHNLVSWFASDIIDIHVLLRLRLVQRSQPATLYWHGGLRGNRDHCWAARRKRRLLIITLSYLGNIAPRPRDDQEPLSVNSSKIMAHLWSDHPVGHSVMRVWIMCVIH